MSELTKAQLKEKLEQEFRVSVLTQPESLLVSFEADDLEYFHYIAGNVADIAETFDAPAGTLNFRKGKDLFNIQIKIFTN